MDRTDYRYCLAHLTVLSCAPPEMIYIAARAGYDYVGLRLIPLGLPGEPGYDLTRDATLLRQTRTALNATGIGVHNIELCRIHDGFDPRDVAPALEVGANLGASDVICSVWTPDRAFYLDMFEQLCALAVPYGLRVNLEYVPFASVRTLADAVDVLRTVPATNGGLMVDTYHAHRSGTDLTHLDDLPRDWFHLAHLCDAPARIPGSVDELRDEVRERRLYLGEGEIDIAGTLHRLPDMVYSLEVPHLARVAEYGCAEHSIRCLEAARSYFGRHPRPVAA